MKLWGGRFTKSTDDQTNHFHSSISFDQRLFRQDIEGSIAYAGMLGRQGIFTYLEAIRVEQALAGIADDLEAGRIPFDPQMEDIHSLIESILIRRTGDLGKRLHTGRSRNDQVALDMRMYVKEAIRGVQALVLELIDTLNRLAKEHTETILPGYTHLQRAQPVTLAHHLLAYIEMFRRDFDRLEDTYRRTNVLPLGSGALAGTTYPLDREWLANRLGFASVSQNSMDAVSDRDFCIDFTYALSVLMMHLSRFCEEIVLWSSAEFAFIELDDGYATGSSIMPQKKNPDIAELIRGKSGRVYGTLTGLLTMMKGLPLAYNKDMQEDKEAVFSAVDTVEMCLPIFSAMLRTMTVKEGTMLEAAKGGFTNATDAADWLVRHEVPFRDAHEIIGRLVLYCIETETPLEDLSLKEYQQIAPIFDETIYDAIRVERCVEARNLTGGPAKEEALRVIAQNDAFLEKH